MFFLRQNIDIGMNLSELIGASPYHRWLGVELIEADEGAVRLRLPFREEFLGNDARTNIHGGIIAALADIAACIAMMSATGGDAPNLNLQVDYLRMAGPDTDLIASGAVVKAGRTIGLSDVRIHTPEGRLIAVGRSTTVNNPPARERLTGD